MKVELFLYENGGPEGGARINTSKPVNEGVLKIKYRRKNMRKKQRKRSLITIVILLWVYPLPVMDHIQVEAKAEISVKL